MKCLLTVLLSFTLLQGFSQEKLNDSVPAKNLSDLKFILKGWGYPHFLFVLTLESSEFDV